MISLAAEGGYQVFTLNGEAWFWLIFSAVTALLAIAVGFYLMRGVLAADEGTPTMIEIATAIQEGAMAYLRRQFKTIAVILIPLGDRRVRHVDRGRQAAAGVAERVVGPHVRRSRACSARSRSSPAACSPASPGSSA